MFSALGNDRADDLAARLDQIDDHIQQIHRLQPKVGHKTVRIQMLARTRGDQNGWPLLAAVAAQEHAQIDHPDQRRYAGHGGGDQRCKVKQTLEHSRWCLTQLRWREHHRDCIARGP
ncbi:hypothetical protein D3C75_1058190 [compost metagenome]